MLPIFYNTLDITRFKIFYNHRDLENIMLLDIEI